tara:strand:+ start:667 stop:1107 length:441 start_codon:yes stop_codon:yes gene_type:complete
MEFDKSPKADNTFGTLSSRYESYKCATNSNQFIEMGGTMNDFIHDLENGLVFNLALVEKNVEPLHEVFIEIIETRKKTMKKQQNDKDTILKKKVKKRRSCSQKQNSNIRELKTELHVMKEIAIQTEDKLLQLKAHALKYIEELQLN